MTARSHPGTVGPTTLITANTALADPLNRRQVEAIFSSPLPSQPSRRGSIAALANARTEATESGL